MKIFLANAGRQNNKCNLLSVYTNQNSWYHLKFVYKILTYIKCKIFSPRNILEKKTFFSLNYGITKLHYTSLVEMNFIQDKSDKRLGIFRFKTVLSNTNSRYSVWIMKTNALGKTAQRATYSLTSEKIGYVQLLWRGNIHRLDVVINKKGHNFVHSLSCF